MLIEPHSHVLKKPRKNKLLYKVISGKNFFDMLEKSYFYFRRVDSYKDLKDSDLPEKDKELYDSTKFERAPHVSLTEVYKRRRKRTFACCFSLQNTRYIWQEYSNGDPEAVCLILNSSNLINYINSNFEASEIIMGEKIFTNNFLSIDYGLVDYINFDIKFLNELAENEIKYVYLKDKGGYSQDREFRISIGASGVYKDFISNGKIINFPENLQLSFSFHNACKKNVIKRIEVFSNCPDLYIKKLNNILIKKDIPVNISKGIFSFKDSKR